MEEMTALTSFLTVGGITLVIIIFLLTRHIIAEIKDDINGLKDRSDQCFQKTDRINDKIVAILEYHNLNIKYHSECLKAVKINRKKQST